MSAAAKQGVQKTLKSGRKFAILRLEVTYMSGHHYVLLRIYAV